MNKSELAGFVQAYTGYLTKSQAKHAVEAVLQGIIAELEVGGDVRLTGFGVFSVKETLPRTGRNPQTGEPIAIPAKTTVKFKVSKSLKSTLN